ncbi:MAG: hypothetical protein AB7V56_16345 [Candidatus Nitrosocosmicus sp.]
MSYLHLVKRSHVAIWKWIQKCPLRKTSSKKRRKIDEFIVDETLLKIGLDFIWLRVAINRVRKQSDSCSNHIPRKKQVCSRERFMSGVVREYGKQPVSTDRDT